MGALEDLIRDGREIASAKDFSAAKNFIRRGEAILCGSNQTLRGALYKHRQTINGYPPYTNDEMIADVETMVSAAQFEIEKNAARLREIEAGSASINVMAQANANAYASVDVALDYASVRSARRDLRHVGSGGKRKILRPRRNEYAVSAPCGFRSDDRLRLSLFSDRLGGLGLRLCG